MPGEKENGNYRRLEEKIDHIRELLEQRCLVYDKHVEDGPMFRDKVIRLETHMKYLWGVLSVVGVRFLYELFMYFVR